MDRKPAEKAAHLREAGKGKGKKGPGILTFPPVT
jgi:hypothetical protein